MSIHQFLLGEMENPDRLTIFHFAVFQNLQDDHDFIPDFCCLSKPLQCFLQFSGVPSLGGVPPLGVSPFWGYPQSGGPDSEPVLMGDSFACPHVSWYCCSAPAPAGASPRGASPSRGATPLGGVYTWDGPWAIPYNARARNVRACPRARARGMNPRRNLGRLV